MAGEEPTPTVWARPILLLALGALAAGCARRPPTPLADLLFLDRQGDHIAGAKLQLPERRPRAGERFSGDWGLWFFRGDFPHAAFPGRNRFAGLVSADGSTICIDLNPGTMHNDVTLTGQKVGGELHGVWSHASTAGPGSGGTFRMSWAVLRTRHDQTFYTGRSERAGE